MQAQYNLGLKYLDGDGVPQDNVQAYIWSALAWSSMSLSGRFDGRALSNRLAASQKMTPAEIAGADAFIENGKPKGSAEGSRWCRGGGGARRAACGLAHRRFGLCFRIQSASASSETRRLILTGRA
jgi:hypothetical protein